ncbi:methyltransferase domain-containing protein [Purpureocillium lavendulum]|uniref:Methyltransferase domain-containing protein n=1 Tax=Purpureocillium lavendulum TaxID=1247861 RepID=A0AB34FNY7_9HYPO|nr:methyltransferase domain-containing protein [Purpureocillium lavendulum]
MGSTFTGRDFGLGVLVGAAAALLLASAAVALVLRSTDIYSLGHWKLNLRTPLDSMWMNLGYWKTPQGQPVDQFADACLGLLTEILATAGLVRRDDAAAGVVTVVQPAPSRGGAVSVLDLGFGCGDQTLALARLVAPAWPDFRYVGLTLNESQRQTASRALHREAASGAADAPDQASFKLFCANAAKPGTWSPAIRDAVEGLADKRFKERWLLALDCLYHFSPSRKPIFELAARKLGANVMAFDLVLNDKASWRERALVRVVGLMMNCPLYTFLTEAQYRQQLAQCGYDADQTVIRDISDDVFAGVADYLQRQERALSPYGISIGGFKLAGRLFGWFDRSRVVRAVIVVGRTRDE